jgi:glycosyltransferase involved in cell wall biosynthesis
MAVKKPLQLPEDDAATDSSVRVSVVVPVYNERENLPVLLNEIDAVFLNGEMEAWRPYEIVFIEDESDDGTGRWIDDAALTNENVRAVHLKRNWGQSAALAAGFDEACGDVIVPMDGDLQNNPADIPKLLAKVEAGADCVSGWRKDRNDPWHKTIPSAFQTRLAKFTGPDINDFGCTLTAYRREALEAIDLRGETHRYIPAQLYDKGYSVTEVEVDHRPREHGESRYGLGRLLRGFVDLIFHWVWVRYSSSPMHLLGGAGVVLSGIGALLGVVSLGQKYLLGQQLAPHLPRLVLVSLLIVTGLLLLVFGVQAELLMKLYYRDETEYRVDRIVD